MDRVILVTGASSGIGAALASLLANQGARVAISARRKERLESLAKRHPGMLVLPADLNIETDARGIVQAAFNHFGRLDVLVLNAAAIMVSPAEQVSRGDLLKGFETNLLGPVAATQEALKIMKEQGRGHIINVGSPGFMMGIPFYTPYVCSKAAFSAWTRTIQAEWVDGPVVISEFFPGYIKTDSRPESRIGIVEQDFLMNKKGNWLNRKFTKPKTAKAVARQIMKLILRPKTIAYSGLGVRLGIFIAAFSRFRLSLASQMARNGRAKLHKS